MQNCLRYCLKNPIVKLCGAYSCAAITDMLITDLKVASSYCYSDEGDWQQIRSFLHAWVSLYCAKNLQKSLIDLYSLCSSSRSMYIIYTNMLSIDCGDIGNEVYPGIRERLRDYESACKFLKVISESSLYADYVELDVAEHSDTDKDLSLEDVMNALTKAVVSQEDAKAAVALGVIKHLMRVNYPRLKLDKSNIILVGPSGCGKTEIVRAVSSTMSVPYVIEDATTITSAGYRGRSVEDVIKDVYKAADGDVKLAEKAIIFLDEVDKLCVDSNNNYQAAYKKGDQASFLKLLEDGIFTVDGKKISTKNMLIIASGAFSSLIKKKQNSQSAEPRKVGFGAKCDSPEDTAKNIPLSVSHKDLIESGMMRELAGRFSIIAVLHPLSEDDMYKIITMPDGIYEQYQKMFLQAGKNLVLSEERLRKLAAEAVKEDIGARGIRSVVDRYMQPLLYDALLHRPKSESITDIANRIRMNFEIDDETQETQKDGDSI